MLKTTRLRDERGFAMYTVMALMLIGGIFLATALASATNDQPSSRFSQDRKTAYAAAEAGVEWYKFQLAQDNDLWNKCTTVPGPSAVNQEWNRTANPTDTRTNWRTVPGSTAKYAVELLPASGTACIASDGGKSMLASNGTFRVRSTGVANRTRRSIVATFRRPSFLDYIYFTDYEDMDPAVRGDNALCAAYRPSRPSSLGCREITFGGGDKVLGPLHTNDSIQASGSPTFGAKSDDSIEIALDKPLTVNGGGTPVFTGTLRSPYDNIPMPDNNGELDVPGAPANGGITLTGVNTIQLDAANHVIKVWANMRPDQTYTPISATNPAWKADIAPTNTYPWPASKVLYDKAGAGCTSTDSPHSAVYTNDSAGCAELFVSGSYSDDLTIGSAGDIIVAPQKWVPNDAAHSNAASLDRVGDPVLGLISNNYVRIWHPTTTSSGSCVNQSPTQNNVSIDAAILALHSFIVDNWDCGKLGTLSVDGAIAQKFRGPVGTGGVSATTGYVKNYSYDSRLRYRNPPEFLKPVKAAWKVMSEHEQVPAT
jgi:Tfp pilus assembly protein PilX